MSRQNQGSRHPGRAAHRRLWQRIEGSLRYYAAHPELIDERLQEIDREWDLERALEVASGAMAVLGLGLGIAGRRGFFLLPALAAGLVVQHAVEGWSVAAPLLRQLGFRTQAEIARERFALKALRGDFANVTVCRRDPREAADDAVDAVAR